MCEHFSRLRKTLMPVTTLRLFQKIFSQSEERFSIEFPNFHTILFYIYFEIIYPFSPTFPKNTLHSHQIQPSVTFDLIFAYISFCCCYFWFRFAYKNSIYIGMHIRICKALRSRYKICAHSHMYRLYHHCRYNSTYRWYMRYTFVFAVPMD